jgi:glycosyltransferase involved in cell wall biosynthesis
MNHIYFFCPDDPRPVGGIKVLYRHVDVLNSGGYDAAIVHKKKGFRCEWFANDTRVDYQAQIKPDRFDFIVLPEVYGPRLADFFPEVRKIIFNQNAYYTFIGYARDLADKTCAYDHPDLAAVLVVSEDSRNYLAHVFPHLKITRIHNSVDGARFAFRDLAQKKKQIAFMPKKHADESLQVINILKFRGALDGVSLLPIENRNERETAELLADSLLFLSFGYPEGSPAPPLEAMLSGCLVVGYHGFGGREYFRPDISWPIEVGDIIGFARTAEGVLRGALASPASYSERARTARDFVLREYSIERERTDILTFWNDLMMELGRDAIAPEL